MRFLVFLWLVFSILVGHVSAKEKNVRAKDEKDVILAEVGPYKLTKAAFEAKLESAPPQIKMILAHQPELKKALVDRWVQITLLSLAAKNAGLDKDPEVKAQIEEATRQILAQAYLQKKILSQVGTVDEKTIEKYYQEHKDRYQEPEAVRARHILIEVPQGATKEQEAQALKKAEEIRQRALKGEDFAKLAEKYSADPGSRKKGGDLGFFTRGQMVKEFEDVAFSLKPGEISKPVRTAFGYHIIKVEAHRPAKQKTLAEVKDQIKEEIIQERQEALLQQALKELKKKYPAKIYTDRL